MMKGLLAVLLLGLAVHHVAGDEEEAYACPTSPGTSCKAFAFLEIEVTGGKCEGEASAECTAITDTINSFDESIQDWWSDEESYCDEGKAEAFASAVAEAIAAVFADAYVKISCDGQGFGCGWSAAGGNAFAIAFAEAIAQASAEAAAELDDDVAESFCYADIRALATVIADATANAAADACTNGGTAEDFQNSVATAITKGIAEAYATAQASACAAEGAADAKTKCTGVGESREEDPEITEVGDACAGLQKVAGCEGSGKDMCCDSEFNRKLCRCEDCDGPWRRLTDFDDDNNQKRSWRDKSQNVCFCT